MTHWLRRVVVGSLCAISSLCTAASTLDDFKQAERIAWSGNYSNFKAAIAQLDHPLKPYVEMAFYKRHPRLRYQQEIEHFLTVYEHTPLEWPVRSAWLEYLQRHEKKRVTSNFIVIPATPKNSAPICNINWI